MIENINDFLFHDQDTKDRVMMLINSPEIFPASRTGIIFYGDYGCGKTTLARLMTNAIDSVRGCSIEMGIDLEVDCAEPNYRTQIRDVEKALNGFLWRYSYKFYILFDEFDNYNEKQTQFKSVTTRPQIGFFITTNDLNKITPSIRSRCYHIELKQPSAKVWASYAKKMFKQRGVALTAAEIQNAISSSRTLSQRDMTATLEILLWSKLAITAAA